MNRRGVLEHLLLPLALLVVATGVAIVYRDAALYDTARQQAIQSERVAALTQSLMSAIKDAETGQRGFLLTGRDSYLEPYNRSLEIIPNDLARLRLEVVRPENQVRIPRLEE